MRSLNHRPTTPSPPKDSLPPRHPFPLRRLSTASPDGALHLMEEPASTTRDGGGVHRHTLSPMGNAIFLDSPIKPREGPCVIHGDSYQLVKCALQALPNIANEFAYPVVAHILAQVRELLDCKTCVVCTLTRANNWLLVGLLATGHSTDDYVYTVFEGLVREEVDIDEALARVLAGRKRVVGQGQSRGSSEKRDWRLLFKRAAGKLAVGRRKSWRIRFNMAVEKLAAKLKGKKNNPPTEGTDTTFTEGYVQEMEPPMHVWDSRLSNISTNF
ncbi:hypothetical protein BZA05DRAFT_418118 [Tricharina praecox]|uniref:uncharacterized protein n=1 Tax=Tricharina praecox TaxID=43433 RepID=UPI00221EA846|nr:uncharacterized protein BZA05DRAFT_418118 [Tricharina praecox]KAI5853305.1 hypothetical protein BZA05DRAFT_418118 [Tricharina praecox]